MRVLHLSSLYAPHAFGGAERVVETLAEGTAARGHEVFVAHLVPTPAAPCERNGVEVRPLRHRNPLWIQDSARYPGPVRNLNKIATLFNVLTARDFAQVLDETRPDIVHSHSMVELTPAMWAQARARGATVVHTLHDYDLLCIRASLFKDGRHCEKRHLACAAFSRIKQAFHGNIDQVVGVSQAILDVHLGHGCFQALPPARRHVIWNPVAASHRVERPRSPADAARPLVFGYIGRLVPEKGVSVLLEACRRLPSSGWQLRVAGRAPNGDADLRAQAAGLPVEFVGFVNPAEFLAGIDVLVVPSIWQEPFGLTIVEAYAAGVPVIGADSGGVAEIVSAVDPSCLVPANDPEALGRKMATLLAAGVQAVPQPDSAAVLARTAPEHVVDEYLHVYSQLLPG